MLQELWQGLTNSTEFEKFAIFLRGANNYARPSEKTLLRWELIFVCPKLIVLEPKQLRESEKPSAVTMWFWGLILH